MTIPGRVSVNLLLSLMLVVLFKVSDAFPGNQATTVRSRISLHAFNELTYPDRRSVLGNVALALGLVGSTRDAQARGLVQFPCEQPLENTYHFLRSGLSLIEEEDIWSTNPLFLTNREAALSEQGKLQVEASIQLLKFNQINPTVCRYSLAAASIDSANIIGKELKIGRDRLVPEFNYMDPRAIGKWDMQPLRKTEYAVWAMDADEGGKVGQGGLPPPNDDSTPNETLHDQTIRLSQLLSVLESQYSGDTILLIFPDGTGPALLSAMIAGIALNRVHELEFAPGEIRLNVNKVQTLALWNARQDCLSDYESYLIAGRKELKRLRGLNDMVSIKDQRLEDDRIALDTLIKQNRLARDQAETVEQTARIERAQATEDQRQLRRNEANAVQRKNAPSPKSSYMASLHNDHQGSIKIFLGTLLVGGLGMVATSQEDKQDIVVGSPAIVVSLSDDQLPSMFDPEKGTLLKPDTLRDPKVIPMSEPVQELPLLSTQDDFSKPNMDPPLLRGQDNPVQTAMDEYMTSDDGGDAWLRMIEDMAKSLGDDNANLIDPRNEQKAYFKSKSLE
jgi:broad specificity phosphatase PhoE